MTDARTARFITQPSRAIEPMQYVDGNAPTAVHLRSDTGGDWEQLWVNGKMVAENHSLSDYDYLGIIASLGVKVTHDEFDWEEHNNDESDDWAEPSPPDM